MNETQQRMSTIVERFQQVERNDFGLELDRLWSAASRLKSAVIDEVQGGNIPVLTGLAITSCIAATTLGYESFHGEPTSTDLLTALSTQQRQWQRQSQPQNQNQQQYDFSS